MNDDRISRYLADQAEGITLTPADPGEVMRRGARRRTRRRSALVGGVAVVAVLAGSVALRDGSDDQQVNIDYQRPDVVPSTFDWATVAPDSGLAYSGSTVQVGGAVYGLSTAPASEDPSNGMNPGLPPSIYRSDDGAEWSEVSSPDGMRVSTLGAAGDTLYALGTAPAGGNTRDLVLSTSTDGASSWQNLTLPRDVAELEARHPGQIMVGQPQLAARDASHLLASIGVSANLDPSQYYPAMNSGERMYNSEWTATGLRVTDVGAMCQEEVARASGADPAGIVTPGDDACFAEARRDAAKGDGEVVFEKTFDELGIDQELRDLIGGRSITYVSEDGATFERVDVPEGEGEWTADLLATDAGYRMVRGSYLADAGVVGVLSSPDGRTWTQDTTLPGSPGWLGVLDGHVAVSTYEDDGNHVRIEQPDGSWSDLPLDSAVTVPAGHQVWATDVAFGPLGLAAVISTADEDGNETGRYLVHSSDGTTLSVLDLEGLVERNVSQVGIAVTADAVSVRFTRYPDDDPGTPPSQVVLVGTPTD